MSFAFRVPLLAGGVLLLLLAGCNEPTIQAGSRGTAPALPTVPASRRVVEEYLKAASAGDGSRLYALVAASERKRETPETLGKTARDRYSSGTTWEVLKTDETDSSSEVIVDFKNAKVDPNPFKFALTKEAGEWRIVAAPELHEREREGGIHIKL